MTSHEPQIVPAFSNRMRRQSHPLVRGAAIVTVISAALVFGIPGCVTATPPLVENSSGLPPISPSNSSSPAPTPTVMDSAVAFIELDQVVDNNGGYPLGHYTTSQTTSAVVDLPDGMTNIGFVLRCTKPGPNWKVAIGDDDSRWASGTCADNLTNTISFFAIQPTDKGQVTVAITTSGPSPVFVVIFASR